MKWFAVILAVAGILSSPAFAARSCRCAGCQDRPEGGPGEQQGRRCGTMHETQAQPQEHRGCCGHKPQPPRRREHKKPCACLHAAGARATLPAPQVTPDARKQSLPDFLNAPAPDASLPTGPTGSRLDGFPALHRPPPEQPSLRATVLLR